MLNVNEEKTKELLNGINEQGVKLENLGLLLTKSGLLVKVHVGRIRGNTKINVKAFGVNDENVLKFMDDYFINGAFDYVGLQMNKKLKSIEANLRKELKERAIGYDGQFLTIPDFRDFKEVFNREKKRYISIRDEIFNDWDNIICNFKKRLKDSLFKMGCEDPNIYQGIIDDIPSKEKYKESFYMEMSLSAFPVLENKSYFDLDIFEELEASKRNDALNCIEDIIRTILSKTFDVLDNTLKIIDEKGCLRGKSKSSFINNIKNLKIRNISGNYFVNEVINDLECSANLLDNGLFDDFLEYGEELLVKIYGYLKAYNLLNKIDFRKTFYSIEQLDMILKIHENSQKKKQNQTV
ncbi:hypothetical protein BFS06_11850 [Clostridium perfringens]|uniref:Uncharacterized protein n=1 Tax=Clostridium perfringens TaxID=1502 RepID=A0A140GS72_CLOPF|nr:hypothetical protein [Clostridium perfringens]AMN31381.1 hypothetical protein JFP838_pA0465 [Clostridium perfringens]TBX14896.1 hypothetical protein BFS06_11850 [Clostridium perfringens]